MKFKIETGKKFHQSVFFILQQFMISILNMKYICYVELFSNTDELFSHTADLKKNKPKKNLNLDFEFLAVILYLLQVNDKYVLKNNLVLDLKLSAFSCFFFFPHLQFRKKNYTNTQIF